MLEKEKIEALLNKKYLDWSNFILHDIIPEDMDPIIIESWKNCKKMGVNPESVKMEVVNRSMWEKKMRDNWELIQVARPIMEKFYNTLSDDQDIFLLYDKDGCVLDYLVPEDYVYRHTLNSPIKGLKFSEQRVGTNSVELCLKHDRPIQVTGPEHYNSNYMQETCYTVPLHDSKGKIMGCINLMGKVELTNPYLLKVMSMTAVAIETQFSLTRATNLVNRAIDVMSEAVLVLDEELQVIRFNKKLIELFQIKDENNLYGIKCEDLFQDETIKRKVLNKHLTCDIFELQIKLLGISRECNVSISPIMSYNRLIGVIALLRPIKDLARLTNKMSGHHSSYTFNDIVTQNETLKETIEIAKKIADTDCSVFIQSESGTGKELFAQAIHHHSKRQSQPLVIVNCAALPVNLVESELFGYEKGAFSGAHENGRPGKFELANGGTIFLDEIGELPLEIQPKLLRVLDSHKVTRLGSSREIDLDVRIIAATNRNLAEEVKKNNFREDLYYRINVIKLNIIPLRKRTDDIPLLAQLFLDRLISREQGNYKVMTSEFLEYMQSYSWPGNVRELQNVISKVYYMSTSDTIDSSLFRAIYPLEEPKVESKEDLSLFTPIQLEERKLIKEALLKYPKDIKSAYESLGMSRATFYRKLTKYDLKH
nr:sigma 54-interacting transcriptional regulator [uncultured Niameybacter sp.]